MRKRFGHLSDTKIVSISPNDRIKVKEDSLDVPPLVSPRYGTDALFELLKGTRSDAKTETSKAKPQEFKTLMKIREARFRLMEREIEIPEDLLGVRHGESGFLN
jgi:predicted nucleotidyltransferase